MIAGRVASPCSSIGASVGPWPSTPIAHDLDRFRRAQCPDRETTARPPRLGVLLRPARAVPDRQPVAAAGDRQQPAVEADEPGLHLGRAEVDPKDRGRRRRHVALPPQRSTASAVSTSVTSV